MRYIVSECFLEQWEDIAEFLSKYHAQNYCIDRIKRNEADGSYLRVFDLKTGEYWYPDKGPLPDRFQDDYDEELRDILGLDL